LINDTPKEVWTLPRASINEIEGIFGEVCIVIFVCFYENVKRYEIKKLKM